MELRIELSSAKDWLSRFKGFYNEYQYKYEKGKKPSTNSDAESSKTGASKACGESSSKGNKAVLWGSEVEELQERLKILEEETEIMKDAFFWSLKERKYMMKEIYQQFQLLNHCLQTRNLVLGESSGVNPFENVEFRKSLPEILSPYPNPSLLTRELKARVLALQEPIKRPHQVSP
ncbi:uncharacterized protein LOC133796430 isoform X2 [Humulus lupulus]|uniref:uncharacterized protein LOC133796430 isoform X2 n=1 Tax=Humulus lupulus TaxID=3486 RepID=UPI002B401304|nr:uncharacterized protein LOC133796430 isoform X2 [Humulus lupulus]